MIPINIENSTDTIMDGMLIATGISAIFDITSAMTIPAATPTIPPMLVNTAASVRNCPKILYFFAPIAFFNPISLVRSVTDTSIIFITPIPPTKREMLAIQMS